MTLTAGIKRDLVRTVVSAENRYEVSFSSANSTPVTAGLERVDGRPISTSNVITSLSADHVTVSCLEPLLSAEYLLKVYTQQQ